MALLPLTPPPPFLQTPGEPVIPFTSWIRMFDTYVLAIYDKELPEARKRALLIHCLGAEAQRIFYNLPVVDNKYETALAALRNFFVPKVNIVAERYKFRQRGQKQGETTEQYIAALREMVVTCNFGDIAEEMIRDQLVEKTVMPRIRERLLLETDLNLQKAMTIASQIETAVAEAKLMDQDKIEPVQAVQPFQTVPRPLDNCKDGAKKYSQPSKSALTVCYRCGSTQHIANYANCPAREAQCRQCKRKGHFARVCRSAQSQQSINEVAVPEVTVLSVQDLAEATIADRITCIVRVSVPTVQNSQDIELMLDTGSAVSILPKAIYMQYFSSSPLTAPKLCLISYSRNPISVLGCVSAKVEFETNCVAAEFYVVPEGTPILGRDLFVALRMQVLNGTITSISPDTTTVHTSLATIIAHKTEEDFGCAKGFIHKVKIKHNVRPVQQKLRRLPFAVRDAVSQEIKNLVQNDIIEAIDSSEWVSPIVVITKKTGNIRLCVDLREPNKAVVVDSHPLPHIEEVFTELRGATLFSTLDLQSAYHQVILHEDSRDLTAFITHEGLFRFKRVPYGLASAPSAFQKMMSLILKNQPGVQCYLDDIIVFGQTPAQHDKHLQTVLQCITDAGLKLNLSKCVFRQKELPFLGHIISQNGLKPDPDHVKAVTEAPPPKDIQTLRSFLGLTSWYAKFVPDYASVVEPLRQLLRGSTPWMWTPAAQTSFETVKSLIVHSPALSLFDPELPTIVTTDASDYGLGAVLTQIHGDNSEKTVAFASRTLQGAERSYSTVEKEALACVWATEKWRTYLWGRSFTLRTDHNPLTTLLTTKGLGRAGMRITRWSAKLLAFTYKMEYRPGTENITADCLSRLPLPSLESEQDEDTEVIAFIASALAAISKEQFKAACLSCPVQCKLRDYLMGKWPHNVRNVDPTLLPFYKIREELSLYEGLVIRGTHRLIVPPELQAKLIQLAHDTHQGIVRTKQRLRDLYWWPGMDMQVEAAIKSCVTCQLHDKTATTHVPPLQPVPLPDSAWEKLAIDIVGPFEKGPADCRYAITLIDYFSKWPEVAFTPTATSATVIKFLSSVFSREGDPKELISDNGTQFTSVEFETFLSERNIKHRRSSVYYPQANGEIERFNRSLKESLQTADLESKAWKPFITEFLQVYRATRHATTQKSPTELLHGREMHTKLSVAGLQMLKPDTSLQLDLRQTVQKKQQKYKTYTDHRYGAKEPGIQCGSFVRVKKPGIIRKGEQRFTLPLKVLDRVGKYTFKLSDGRIWNARYLARAYSGSSTNEQRWKTRNLAHTQYDPVTDTNEHLVGIDDSRVLPLAQNSQPRPLSDQRPQRTRQQPAWAKDYVK